MDDKDLLELAAKAAGIDTSQWCDLIQSGCGCGFVLPDSFGDLWNPLTYDGDAFRLAAKLMMSIEVSEYEASTYAYAGKAPRVYAMELWRDDVDAATRRAIVRAAAEVGKSIT